MNTKITNELVANAQQGCEESKNQIVAEMDGWITSFIKKKGYYLKGYTQEDFKQIAFIGLLEAIDRYDESKGEGTGNFIGYAMMVMRTKIIRVLKDSNQDKRKADFDTFHLEQPTELGGKDNTNTYMDFLESNEKEGYGQPEKVLAAQEIYQTIKENVSEREWQIFQLWLYEYDYTEIKEMLQLKDKRVVDNGIQRVKKKIQKIKEKQPELI